MTPPAAQSRKDVTIVFADLAGSTTLAERMDPESVRSAMDAYYAAIRRVVEERRGRIVKFIGDGVMAVFGVPETSEDDARRALDAALDDACRVRRLGGPGHGRPRRRHGTARRRQHG